MGIASSLGSSVTPSDQQGTAGNSGVPPAADAGAKMKMMKTGEAVQRIQAARVLVEIAAGLKDYGHPHSELFHMADDIATEAATSLLPVADSPMPGASNQVPIESESRP